MTTPAQPALDRELEHIRKRAVATHAKPQRRCQLMHLAVGAWPEWLFCAGEDDPAHETERQNDG
jgi:hypothetical protein